MMQMYASLSSFSVYLCSPLKNCNQEVFKSTYVFWLHPRDSHTLQPQLESRPTLFTSGFLQEFPKYSSLPVQSWRKRLPGCSLFSCNYGNSSSENSCGTHYPHGTLQTFPLPFQDFIMWPLMFSHRWHVVHTSSHNAYHCVWRCIHLLFVTTD